MEHLELKIEMIKARILHDKQEEVQEVEHLPEERKLIFHTSSHEIAISGSLYDRLEQAVTMPDVLKVYDMFNLQ